MTKGLLAIGPRRRSLQHPEAIAESISDLARAHRRHPGRGQLDAERKPVERLADLDHGRGRLGILKPEVGPHRASAVGEQRDRIGRDTTLEPEWRDRQERLSRDPQVLA